jgi:hypothetical protein
MYTIDNYLTTNDVNDLIGLYDSLESNMAHQDYNLFDVDKRLIKSDLRKDAAFLKLEQAAGKDKRVYSHYFLDYLPESFTRSHTDNVDDVVLTMVTILDETGLVGGETIVHLPYEKKVRPGDRYAKRLGDNPPVGQEIIPQVVPVTVGQTMTYDHALTHGVCQVTEGRRLVLVSWYAKAD